VLYGVSKLAVCTPQIKKAVTGIAYRNNLGNKKLPLFANAMEYVTWHIKEWIILKCFTLPFCGS
jgi:hypothetical protein